jgi:hypothetical protein
VVRGAHEKPGAIAKGPGAGRRVKGSAKPKWAVAFQQNRGSSLRSRIANALIRLAFAKI